MFSQKVPILLQFLGWQIRSAAGEYLQGREINFIDIGALKPAVDHKPGGKQNIDFIIVYRPDKFRMQKAKECQYNGIPIAEIGIHRADAEERTEIKTCQITKLCAFRFCWLMVATAVVCKHGIHRPVCIRKRFSRSFGSTGGMGNDCNAIRIIGPIGNWSTCILLQQIIHKYCVINIL